MTSIRVPDIIQIQLLAVRKCATDSSPYVRKCAATALTKIYHLDNDQLGQLKEIMDKLLKDSSTMVLGSAVAAFNEICPTAYDILHRNYRKLCHLLADMDEWTQVNSCYNGFDIGASTVSVLEVMTRYVRNQFTDPAPGVAAVVRLQAKQRSGAAVKGRTTVKRRTVKKAFYSDEEDESGEETVEVGPDPVRKTESSDAAGVEALLTNDTEGDLDPDHRLILKSSLPLLKSRNSGVVLGVCSLHYYCGSQNSTTTTALGKALVRILRSSREVQYVVLNCINTMARERPSMFRPYFNDFFVKSGDPVFNRLLKLEILTSISHKDNIPAILRELQIYIKDSNQQMVSSVVTAIGRIADADSSVSDACIEGIMHLLLCSKVDKIVRECVVVLRQMLQQNTTSAVSHKVLRQLVKLLVMENGLEEPTARTNIVWLVGEFHSVLHKVAPDVLRILASGFVDEGTETKAQILNLAIKLSLNLPDSENVQSLMTYVLEMARFDADLDLRDRSRFMTALMGLAPSNDENSENPIDEDALAEFSEHASGIMLATKLPPVTLLGTVDDEGMPNFSLGSLSSLVGHNIQGYEPLANWPKVQPDPTIRDAVRYAEQDAEEESKSFVSTAKKSSSKDGKKGRKDSADSSEDDLLAVFSKKKKEKADSSSSSSSSSSGSDSSSDSSSSGSESDSEVESDKSASESGSESGSSSSSSDSGDDDEVKPEARVPLAQQKITSSPRPVVKPTTVVAPVVSQSVSKAVAVSRPGMRKVAPKGKHVDPVTVLAASASTTTTSLVDDFDALDISKATSTTSSSEHNDSLLSVPSAVAPQAASSVHILNSDSDDMFMGPSSNMGTMQPLSTSSSNFISALSMSSDDGVVTANVPIATSVFDAPSHSFTDSIATIPFTNSAPLLASTSTDSAKMSNHMILNTYNTTAAPTGSQSSKGPPVNQTAPVGPPVSLVIEDLAEPKVLLRPEMGGGLSVTLVLRNNAVAVAYVGAISAYLLVRNTTKDRVIRRIKVSFPQDLRKTAVPDIPLLGPEQEVQIPMEMVLSGVASKQVKADIRCDQGAYVGLLVINDWDLLLPYQTTSADFEVLRKRLSGFNEVTRMYPVDSLNLPQGDNADTELELISRVRRIANMYLVQGAGVGELMFAGSIRKGTVEEKAYITILIGGTGLDGSEQVTVRFNCEDVVLCTGLSEAFKKLLPKAASIADYLHLSPSETFLRIATVLKSLGIRYVFDASSAGDIALIESREEFMMRYRGGRQTVWEKPVLTTANSFTSVNVYPVDTSNSGRNGWESIAAAPVSHVSAVGPPAATLQVPMLTSNCPGWICYAEKNSPQALPYVSTVKSPQQIIGTLIKNILLSDTTSSWNREGDEGQNAMDVDGDITDSLDFGQLSILDRPSGDRAGSYEVSDVARRAKKVFVVSIQPCFDKKLEASRRDFYHSESDTNEVDLVLSTAELWGLLEEQAATWNQAVNGSASSGAGISGMTTNENAFKRTRTSPENSEMTVESPPTALPLSSGHVVRKFLLSVAADRAEGCDSFEAMFRMFSADGQALVAAVDANGGSGGYAEYVFKYAAQELFGVDLWSTRLQYKEGREGKNPDFAEIDINQYLPPSEDPSVPQRRLKFARAYGFKNIQLVMNKMRMAKCDLDFVEVMACPSGCNNGGGQLKLSAGPEESADVVYKENINDTKLRGKRVDALFHSGLSRVRRPDDSLLAVYLYSQQRLGLPMSAHAMSLLHTRYHAVPKLEILAPLATKW
eukprot:gene21954-28034_t